jgi:uncharacterized protein involved in outer membrane biogenesis
LEAPENGILRDMRTFLTILGKTLVVLACICALLFISRNFMGRKSFEVGVRAVTGFPMSIKDFELASNLASIDVSDLRMTNPQDVFSEPHFITISSLHMDYDVMSMVKRSPHIKLMTMEIPKISIVRSNQGVYNIMQLKSITDVNNPMPQDGKPKHYQLDKLRIKLGTVVVEDFTNDQHKIKTYDINKPFEFTGINDPLAIPQSILMAVMTSPDVKIPDLNIRIANLKASVGKMINQTEKDAVDVINKAVPATK